MLDPTIRSGDHVEAVAYYGDGDQQESVTGTYRPRDTFEDSLPPVDAAWVETDDYHGTIMVRAATVQRVPPTPEGDPAQGLVDAAHALRKATAVFSQLPLLPRIHLHPEEPADPMAPNPRHVTVQVRTVPVGLDGAEVHRYNAGDGLTWQTYGNGDGDDYSTERMLDIVDGNGEAIATYPAGTWLSVSYVMYRETGEGTLS